MTISKTSILEAGPVSLDQIYIGCNIYCWDIPSQNALLVEALLPLSVQLVKDFPSSLFWFCRFDARGPHLFIVVSTLRNSRLRIRDLLEKAVARFVQQRPSRVVLPVSELEQRHKECRGKALCPIDRLDGIAQNNSFTVFDQPCGEYPFARFRDVADSQQLWSRLSQQSIFVLHHLKSGSARLAVGWAAALTHALHKSGISPQSYWKFHASTLMMSSPDNEHDWLRQMVSDRNRVAFAQIWADTEGVDSFDLPGLLNCIFTPEVRNSSTGFPLVREIAHQFFGQLGLWLKFQTPIVLYAWLRCLPD